MSFSVQDYSRHTFPWEIETEPESGIEELLISLFEKFKQNKAVIIQKTNNLGLKTSNTTVVHTLNFPFQELNIHAEL